MTKKMIERNLPEGLTLNVRYVKNGAGRITRTVATISEDGLVVGLGEARTSKRELHPNRKMGRHIAVGRAMRMAGLR